ASLVEAEHGFIEGHAEKVAQAGTGLRWIGNQVLIAHLVIQPWPQSLPSLPPQTHFALPPQGRRYYRVFSPCAVAAGALMSMVPAQDRKADVPAIPDQMNDPSSRPESVQGGHPLHEGRGLVPHQGFSLLSAVEIEEPVQEGGVGDRPAGVEQ